MCYETEAMLRCSSLQLRPGRQRQSLRLSAAFHPVGCGIMTCSLCSCQPICCSSAQVKHNPSTLEKVTAETEEESPELKRSRASSR